MVMPMRSGECNVSRVVAGTPRCCFPPPRFCFSMLSRLQLSDFRNYGTAEADLSPSLNVILGDNGSGKTSLLEAIYFIGSGGRSFRGGRLSRLVRDGAEAATLYAEVTTAGDMHRLGVRRTPGGIDAIKLNGQTPRA